MTESEKQKKKRTIDLGVWLTSYQDVKCLATIAKGQQNGHFEINSSGAETSQCPGAAVLDTSGAVLDTSGGSDVDFTDTP